MLDSPHTLEPMLGVGPERGLRGGGRRGWCEEWARRTRTILLLHIISVRPSKQPLMVRTFLKVYMELDSFFLFLQEQIKDIIIMQGNTPVEMVTPWLTDA
jgi:hypothetical protein